MKVKTFHALTMQDALRAIKEELGPDAIILSSKEVREGGRVLRAFNHPVLEVMAAAEYESPPPVREGTRVQASTSMAGSSGASPSTMVPVGTFQQTLRGILEPPSQPTIAGSHRQESSKKSAASPGKQNRRRVRVVYDELSRLLRDLSPGTTEPQVGPSWLPLSTLRQSLGEQGLSPSTIELLLSEVLKTTRFDDHSDEQAIRYALHQQIARLVRVTGPLRHPRTGPTIGLLMGPSGAGKTSAVAKLAAYHRSERRKSVAVITFDTYREIAVEQLRRYAKIIGVPFACALSARQVQAGLRRHAQVDLVLIDMPGIAPADLALANDLCRLLKDNIVMTHLVLPASIRVREACRIADCVRTLPGLRLLFTKLDEAESYGTMFEVAHTTGVPLSYWTVGRRVPGDIEVVSPDALATRLTTSDAEAPGQVRQSDQSAETKPALAATGTYHR